MIRAAFLLIAVAAPAVGPPPVFVPTADFYGARGPFVTVRWTADRTTVPADGDLVLTLTVRGVTNPRDVTRPPLAKLPPFAASFHPITDLPDPPPAADARDVRFRYKVRPRNRDVTAVPTLTFVSLTPANAANTAYTKGPALTVTAPVGPPPAPAPTVPVDGPDGWFAVAPWADPPRDSAPLAGVWLALLGPVAGLTWYVVWLRVYPDAAAVAKRRRSRAAGLAVRAIRKADRSPDPAATVAEAVRAYLRDRAGLPAAAVTPGEVADALGESAAVAVLRRCDAARFAPTDDSPAGLADEAVAAITAWEAA